MLWAIKNPAKGNETQLSARYNENQNTDILFSSAQLSSTQLSLPINQTIT